MSPKVLPEQRSDPRSLMTSTPGSLPAAMLRCHPSTAHASPARRRLASLPYERGRRSRLVNAQLITSITARRGLRPVRRWDPRQRQHRLLLWVTAMWAQEEDPPAAGSSRHPQLRICGCYKSARRSDLIASTESADLFPRVKQLVQQLFILNKLKALLLNTYFQQAENINLT